MLMTTNNGLKMKSNLQTMLQVKNFSIREFARRIDYRFDTVRKVHNNDIQRIPVDFIERACAELNCSIGELFYLEREED